MSKKKKNKIEFKPNYSKTKNFHRVRSNKEEFYEDVVFPTFGKKINKIINKGEQNEHNQNG